MVRFDSKDVVCFDSEVWETVRQCFDRDVWETVRQCFDRKVSRQLGSVWTERFGDSQAVF